jgi:hypothetical protein
LCPVGNHAVLAGDWAVVDTQNKSWQNLALAHLLARASKAGDFEVVLEGAVVVSVEASEAIEADLVETEVALAEIEVGMAGEAALVTRAVVALEVEEDSRTVRHHRMRRADQAEREAVGMAAGTELALRTVLDPTMATAAVAMDLVLVVNVNTAAARVARPGLTAVEISEVA